MKTSVTSLLLFVLSLVPDPARAAEGASYEALAAAGAAGAWAQSPPVLPARAQVSVRPLLLIYNQLGVDYEQMVAPKLSLTGGVKAGLSRSWTQSVAADRLNAIVGLTMPSAHSAGSLGLELGARHWLSSRPLHGFFLSPTLGYDYAFSGLSERSGRGDQQDVPAVHRILVNLRAGHQWIFAERLALSLDGGLYYAHVYAARSYSGDQDHLGRGQVGSGWRSAGFAPEVHLGLGWWF